jgi:hypothetical protein
MIIAKVISVFIVSLLFLPGMNALAVWGWNASFLRARDKGLLRKWPAG